MTTEKSTPTAYEADFPSPNNPDKPFPSSLLGVYSGRTAMSDLPRSWL
ncbi:hypothetical protein CGLO_12350 [Colletotrichum gloeosporioides Cg-14]|uniref:Uncharacterized protein n=1 Tax=Colletotrichum gloeosporioides (strain Cg-14) TaxID=1237896 RepID=T0LJP1_COLGC|nr:hypothetical protein CGLO_12350 [Colletotrichum gloeosporioides Cg-14]